MLKWVFAFLIPVHAIAGELMVVTAHEGDAASKILHRFDLLKHDCNLEAFYELNHIGNRDKIIAGRTYKLPIYIYQYNGISIRSTIENDNYDKALRIQAFNRRLEEKSIKKSPYEQDKRLYVPYHELHCSISHEETRIEDPLLKTKISILDQRLKGKTVYLVTGHGGPDPGSITNKHGQMLCEDEYAYDICLRLYKQLKSHGATVHMMVQDKNDGIRNERLLVCDKDEISSYGKEIPLNQLRRLQLRVQEINSYFHKYRYEDQICISIHVDSRSKDKRQDVFFCHYTESNRSSQIAQTLRKTFAKKYEQHQKNRKYFGHTEGRNLYVLKHTKMPSVLVEVGNIQNTSDHRRILDAENRQALAQWLYEGTLEVFK